MKLKALLLGSAAALIAVSGAHAADAVVAEPEPVDYVKVCDMYGAGFFYIPGTETCLKMSGYVRVEYDISQFTTAGVDTETTANSVTGRVNFDARSETDYGTLQSWIRFEGSNSNATGAIVDSAVIVNDAWINLGNLSMGRRDHRATLAALPGGPFDGDDHGLGEAYYVDYTFAANGLSVVAGLGTQADADNANVYLRADYSGSMYNIAASVTHVNHVAGVGDAQQYNIWGNVTPVDGLTIQGYYNDTSVSNTARWGVGASFALMDDVTLSGGYWDSEDSGTGYFGQVSWNVASGLNVIAAAEEKDGDNGTDETSFRLRVTRSF
jgi:hypothetical protein